MKIILKFFLLLCFNFFVSASYAEDIVVIDRHWKITYVEKDKWFRLNLLNSDGTARKALFNRSISEVKYDDASGKEQVVNTKSFAQVAQTETEINDEFGTGRCYAFTFIEPDNGDDVCMEQRFYVYDNHDYLITDLSIIGDASIRSNYLAPVSVSDTYMLFSENEGNRMLKVPFDNDGFVRYHKYQLNQDMISYEVSAFYNGDSREGLILGSVDHNRWKSAISASASEHGKINALKVFSGVSNEETRDVLPHGKVNGPTITSARFFIHYVEDWRIGMEEFGHANTLVQPMRDTWTKGTPFGWQSWGVLSDKNSYGADSEIADYYNEVLKPGGFVNNQNVQIISIDSWDNMNDSQKKALAEKCEENGQIVGLYCTPFASWWNTIDEIKQYNLEGTTYKIYDCCLKVNGEPFKLDGAFCLDPTHPGTKTNIAYQLRRMKNWGYKYVKVDFTSNAMVQADSYFAKSCKTAVEAYTNGFNYFKKIADEGEPMFVALSIAPIFPYQYGNSRRIACDTWARIDQTEYSMNAISGGWWTNQFYQYNDPDHLVLRQDGILGLPAFTSEGENRARYTNGAVSGMMLVGDNFSLTETSGKGHPEDSRKAAETIMMNKDINEMADLGRSFMPIYGNREYKESHEGAESCFMYHTDKYLYVAVFNYSNSDVSGSIDLADLNISKDNIETVKELWSGDRVEVVNDLSYTVPKKDVKVFRFQKKGGGAVENVWMEDGGNHKLDIKWLKCGEMTVIATVPLVKCEVFDMSGIQLQAVDVNEQCVARVVLPEYKGVLLVRATTCVGDILFAKVIMGR